MSHVATGDVEVTDLDALEAACAKLAFEFRRGQKTYRWYGSWVDDTRVPDGMFSPQETERVRAMPKQERVAYMNERLGRCEHAVRVPGASYEVGVVRRWDGKWNLAYDYWGAGGLAQRLGGPGAPRLRQAYTVEKARREFSRSGNLLRSERVLADGSVELVFQGK